MSRRCFAISAVNVINGGPLTALRACLEAAACELGPEWDIVALVHDRDLLAVPRVRLLEFPLSRKSWLARLYYEFWRFKRISRELKPDVWLSLHDITPRVDARRRAVYCHNASPFYRATVREAMWDPTFFLFTLFYRHLYRLNIHRNTHVIVQQAWLRREFARMYGLENIVVAYPHIELERQQESASAGSERKVFLYPSLPRVFKNVEIIGEAVRHLNRRNVRPFEVRITFDGTETPYARAMLDRFGSTPGLSFIGFQDAEKLDAEYRDCDVVLFPSRLETWGLPISEAKAYGKPLIVADLPYAHETVGTYSPVAFFDPRDPVALADLMQAEIEHRSLLGAVSCNEPEPPLTHDWRQLIDLLTRDPLPVGAP